MFAGLLTLLRKLYEPDPFATLTPELARDIGVERAGPVRVRIAMVEMAYV